MLWEAALDLRVGACGVRCEIRRSAAALPKYLTNRNKGGIQNVNRSCIMFVPDAQISSVPARIAAALCPLGPQAWRASELCISNNAWGMDLTTSHHTLKHRHGRHHVVVERIQPLDRRHSTAQPTDAMKRRATSENEPSKSETRSDYLFTSRKEPDVSSDTNMPS